MLVSIHVRTDMLSSWARRPCAIGRHVEPVENNGESESASKERRRPKINGRKAKWIDMDGGVRIREPSKAAAAAHRKKQAQDRAMQRRIEADTCGLGHWREPAGWCTEPFVPRIFLQRAIK